MNGTQKQIEVANQIKTDLIDFAKTIPAKKEMLAEFDEFLEGLGGQIGEDAGQIISSADRWAVGIIDAFQYFADMPSYIRSFAATEKARIAAKIGNKTYEVSL